VARRARAARAPKVLRHILWHVLRSALRNVLRPSRARPSRARPSPKGTRLGRHACAWHGFEGTLAADRTSSGVGLASGSPCAAACVCREPVYCLASSIVFLPTPPQWGDWIVIEGRTSCVKSSATSCAASFTGSFLTCASFTCHLRASVAWVPPLTDDDPSSAAASTSSATSCVTSSTTSCAKSFTCSFLTCSSVRHVLRQVLHVRPSRVT